MKSSRDSLRSHYDAEVRCQDRQNRRGAAKHRVNAQNLAARRNADDRFVGELLPVTPITDYRSVGQLIDAYNANLATDEIQYAIDEQVVVIRDRLAHGRILGAVGDDHMTLFRFNRPANGRVQTTMMRALTSDALDGDVAFLQAQFQNVWQCGVARQIWH